MHYSPGAPILRSYDLVNWEFIGHSVPVLDWSSKYDLTNGQRAYVKGIWASSLRYRPSNGLWYWAGCIEFATSYMYTARSPTGPWTKSSTINNCWYDCGILIDDNDTMYVAYGNTQISVAQLSSDGLTQVKTQVVYNAPSSIGALEGNRFYKVNGKYYIFTDHPATAEYVLQASSPFGPYTIKALVNSIGTPVSGTDNPHQGGSVPNKEGQWYYMAFVDAYPGGRIPVLAPINWGSDGFPTLQSVNGAWGKTYTYPETPRVVASPTGTDSFSGTSLGPQWEWNHNPDTTKFTVNNGLTLHTATVTFDLYSARNTLSHRLYGPTSSATIIMDISHMAAGDRAGLVLLRHSSAWVGIMKNGTATSINMINNLTMDSDWNTVNTGAVVAGVTLTATKVWLRASADIHSGSAQQAKFSYSLDGNTFNSIGSAFTMNSDWEFFMGYRFGIFNYATLALGGYVTVSSFTMTS
jgi:beta-xylosidase